MTLTPQKPQIQRVGLSPSTLGRGVLAGEFLRSASELAWWIYQDLNPQNLMLGMHPPGMDRAKLLEWHRPRALALREARCDLFACETVLGRPRTGALE